MEIAWMCCWERERLGGGGTMDAKALPEVLKEKLKWSMEVAPSKKDDGSQKKEKGGNKKEKGDGGGGGKDDAAKAAAAAANRIDYHAVYPYGFEMVHVPQNSYEKIVDAFRKQRKI